MQFDEGATLPLIICTVCIPSLPTGYSLGCMGLAASWHIGLLYLERFETLLKKFFLMVYLFQLSYIPAFVFPFIVLFGNDELSTLEICMTILMWWGYSWHATFPNPPIHITEAIDQLLRHHDDTLYAHLRRLGVSPGLVGWTLLQTLFTEMLGREDWLRFMDYIITRFGDARVMLTAPVALLRCVRTSLLLAGDASHLVGYCRHQQGVSVAEAIAHMQVMLDNTPSKFFACCPQQTLATVLREETARQKRGVTLAPQQQTDDVAAGQENMALHAGNPLFPLPTGE